METTESIAAPVIDERDDLFEIDYDTYFSKQVLEQLKEFRYIESVANVLDEYKESLKNE